MSERLKFEGRLRELERDAREIRVRIAGLRDSVRNHLDPFEEIERLKAAVAAAEATELAALQLRYNNLLAQIRTVKDELGER